MIELDILSQAERAADDDAQAADRQPRLWRSAADRDNAPGYAEARRKEFMDGALAPSELTGDAGPDRRTFLKVMGASVAMAGLTGCRRPVEEILPYARKPENVIPGIANYYATSMPHGGVSYPVLVQSHEGRPTKIEGNPEHPISQGAADAFAYASVLNLYDPDRSRFVYRDGQRIDEDGWQAALAALAALRLRAQSTPLAVLATPDASPTARRLREQVEATFPNTRWITLHPEGDDPVVLGTQQAFGRPLRPLYRFSEADTIVTFDGDFLGPEDPNSVFNGRQYAASRRVEDRELAGRPAMSRTYAVESTYTITGGMADHRLAFKAGEIPLVAAAVAQALGVSTGAPTIAATPEATAFIAAIADDVQRAPGRTAFVAGRTQPAEIHALCAALNARFGADCVSYLDAGEDAVEPVGPQLAALVRDMAAGRVGAVMILGTNPVYTLPAELNFAAALARVPVSFHVGLWRDESAQQATWHIPEAHYLESWGDGRAYDGTFGIIQPLIRPLYVDAHSTLEVLGAMVTGRDVSGYDLVREAYADRTGAGAGTQTFENDWRTLLHDGFLPDTQFPAAAPAAGTVNLSGLQEPPEAAIELVTRVSPQLYDGLYSNNGWMQETPHPVTKVVWDNVAVMSRATANALGVSSEIATQTVEADTVTIASPSGGTATLPVWVQPGHPDNSITAFLGYGREIQTDRVVEDRNLLARLFDKDVDVYTPGPLGNGIGQSVEPLRRVAYFPVVPAVEVAPSEVSDFPVVTTQDHGSMEGRAIVRMQPLAEYTDSETRRPFDAEHLIEDTPWESFPPLWGEENGAAEDPEIGAAMYSDNQWGMAIDLNSCTGCNACIVACTSENNVPVVGKDQVGRGREMHWLRVDRYYVGGEETDRPGMVLMPMMCQHCENAPCEQVCPVAATVHSPDGTNAMIYNRCIGTRYCANNCPYKVRRYNFYNWTKTLPLEVRMQQNPNVTVRYRGVMEKCSFCIHRIRRVQQYAHIEDGANPDGRPLADGEVLTACQQACPSEAIVFGDLTDPTSAVNRAKASDRNYALLAELAVKPRLTYLARLRNPHPSLAGENALNPYYGLEPTHDPATHADEPEVLS